MDNYLAFASANPIIVAGLAASFLLLIFSELKRKASGLVAINAAEAVQLMNNDAIVIDIRSPEAFGRGHIVNARNIPLDELPAKMDSLKQYQNRPLVAVCDAGISSNKAVKDLREAGFESAYGLKGGMTAWTQDGMPVVSGKKTKGSKSARQKKRKDG